MKLGLLDDYQGVALVMADWSALVGRAEIEVFREPFADLDAAAAALAEFDILCIMRERLRFPGALIERLPRLKCLITTGSYNAAIDLAAATARGVIVCGTTNGPGTTATAELAWGLVLAAVRQLPREDRAVRHGQWQTGLGRLVEGRTIGLIGLGAVGSVVARYAAAFGMRMLAWSPNLTAERAAEFGARRVDKEVLLRESDIVSLHIVLSDRTRGLIGARELALMRRSAVLVNTSRGPLVDEAALVAALAEGRIAGAALDVFDHEPLPAGHPLRGCADRVVLTPHIGYVTEEVYRVFYRDTAEAARAFLDGKPIRVLNPT